MAKGEAIRTSNAAALQRLQKRVEGYSEKQLRTVVTRSISSVRRKFEPEAKRVIRDTYNVRVEHLTGKFRVLTGSDQEGEYVELAAARRGVPLLYFGAQWRGRSTPGATAEIRKGQRKTYRSAFITTIRGRTGVFARQFSADSNSPSGRDPRNKVRLLTGPSPAQMTQGVGMANARRISSAMTSYLSSEIARQLELARKS